MSTRATVYFRWKKSENPDAIIYIHSDGYPEEMLPLLKERFVSWVSETYPNDVRFDDPAYLAARFIYFLYATDPYIAKTGIGVGIVRQEPGDTAYSYDVICDGAPTVRLIKVDERR